MNEFILCQEGIVYAISHSSGAIFICETNRCINEWCSAFQKTPPQDIWLLTSAFGSSMRIWDVWYIQNRGLCERPIFNFFLSLKPDFSVAPSIDLEIHRQCWVPASDPVTSETGRTPLGYQNIGRQYMDFLVNFTKHSNLSDTLQTITSSIPFPFFSFHFHLDSESQGQGMLVY